MIEREYFDKVFGPLGCEIASSHTYIEMLDARQPVDGEWYRVDVNRLVRSNPNVDQGDIERLVELGYIQVNDRGLFRFPAYEEVQHLEELVVERIVEVVGQYRVILRDRLLKELQL